LRPCPSYASHPTVNSQRPTTIFPIAGLCFGKFQFRAIPCYPLPCLSPSMCARATPVRPDPEVRPSPVFHSSALPSSPLTLLESPLAQKRGERGSPQLSSSRLPCCSASFFQHAPQRELACPLNPRINPKDSCQTPNPFFSRAESRKPTEPSAST